MADFLPTSLLYISILLIEGPRTAVLIHMCTCACIIFFVLRIPHNEMKAYRALPITTAHAFIPRHLRDTHALTRGHLRGCLSSRHVCSRRRASARKFSEKSCLQRPYNVEYARALIFQNFSPQLPCPSVPFIAASAALAYLPPLPSSFSSHPFASPRRPPCTTCARARAEG